MILFYPTPNGIICQKCRSIEVFWTPLFSLDLFFCQSGISDVANSSVIPQTEIKNENDSWIFGGVCAGGGGGYKVNFQT